MKSAARVVVAFLVALPALAGAKELPNLDAFAEGTPLRQRPALLKPGASPLLRAGADVQLDDRLGVPTFLWASPEASSTRGSLARWSTAPEQAARGYLADFAPFYRLSPEEAASAVLHSVHDTGKGPVIVRFRQVLGGVEVFRGQLNVLMTRDRELVALSGHLSPHAAGLRATAPSFPLPASAAVARAFEDLNGSSLAPDAFRDAGLAKAGYQRFALDGALPADNAATLGVPARAKPVWFELGRGLEPAYYVEVDNAPRGGNDSEAYAYVVSANDGRLLFRKNLTEYDAFTYRVWADPVPPYIPWDNPTGTVGTPHPTGVPNGYQAPFLPPNDVTLRNVPFSRNDPWLPPSAHETVGNNVDAYADLFSPDGYGPPAPPAEPATGDFRARTTGFRAFRHTYDTGRSPLGAEQRQAAITQLFFVNNFLHDWYYDAGFDEAAGNAQERNYGRGGLEGDALRAEAQDFGGRNNANMMTPADGSPPRMQMYVFDAITENFVHINTPAQIAGRKQTGTATFGPQVFDVTGQVAYAQPNNGCGPFTNTAAIAGKIALVDRGDCPFLDKADHAQNAGAIGLLVVNNVEGIITMSGTGPVIIPALSLLQTDGAAIKTALAAGTPVIARMFRSGGVDRDGTLDDMIVAHEWGHFISNRLIADAAGLGNNLGRGLGEGWSDFHALLMTTRASDAAHPANPSWSGAFAMATYALSGAGNQGFYFGVRRLPYSTDFRKNALTFKHIQNGVPLPTGVPTAFGLEGTDNAEVHNTGEVWATMLWECYTSLLKDVPRLTFDQARDRMKAYLVAAYKLTPANPTLTEARDALLAVAYANDPADYRLFGQAFARRGAGIGAVSPDRFSADHVGVVESFLWGNDLVFDGATLDDSTSWCDRDGFLDNGETGRLTVSIRNTGAGELTRATATVSADSPAVGFPRGNVISFPATAPYARSSAGLDVTLTGAAPLTRVTFTFRIEDPTLAQPRVITATARFLTQADDVPNASATDTAESPTVRWTFTGDPALGNTSPWRRVTDAEGGHYLGPDPNEGSDQYLVSPPLQVAASGTFRFTFRHRFDFEADPPEVPNRVFYDGGTLELSQDGGATWVDAGVSANPGYNGVLTAYPGNVNPLAGRAAFVGRSEGYPAYQPVTVDLGTAYAGRTVLVRFRLGADASVAATGWEVDDIAFTGITNTPFNLLTGDRGQCVNRRPSADAGPDATVDERALVLLDGTGSHDVDGDVLRYAWTQVGGPAVSLSNADRAVAYFTAPEVTADTVLTFQLVVTDPAGNTSLADTVQITVRDVNRAPVAVACPNQLVDERRPVELDGSESSDPEGDALRYAWTQVGGPAVTLVGANGPKATFTAPEVTSTTELTFQLVVSDGRINSAPALTRVTVRHVNRAPVANAGAHQLVDEHATVRLDGTGSTDPDGDTLRHTWVQTAGPAVRLSSTTSARPTFTAPEVTGNTLLAFSLVVDDGTLTSAPSSVAILVQNVNRAPVADAGADLRVNERAPVSLRGGGSDPDGDVLGYAWTQVGGPSVPLLGATTANASFTAPDVASNTVLTFQLTVSDGAGSSSDTVRVTVLNENRAPVVDAGPNQVVAGGAAVVLGGAANDVDGDPLTYAWVQTAGPSVTLGDATRASAHFTAPVVVSDAVLTFQLTVSDGVMSHSDTVSVTVRRTNRAPSANAGLDFMANERTAVTLRGSASDPNADALTYVWKQVSGPAVTLRDADAPVATFPAPEVTGSTVLRFSLTVSDGAATVVDHVNVTVLNVNRAPAANAGVDQRVNERTRVTLRGTGTDADGDRLSHAWSQLSGPAVTLSDARASSPWFTAPRVGSSGAKLTFRLVVSDGRTSTSDTVTITVRDVERLASPDRSELAGAGAPEDVDDEDGDLPAPPAPERTEVVLASAVTPERMEVPVPVPMPSTGCSTSPGDPGFGSALVAGLLIALALSAARRHRPGLAAQRVPPVTPRRR